MSTPFLSNNNYFPVKSAIFGIITALFLIIISGEGLYAQAKLSVQGIVKKSNGVALEDGEYSITFNIYAKDGTPAGVLWFETIADVEVIGGIYSVILGGNGKALDLPFDQDYELGVKIGSSELLPRIDLTSAPYALSLRGSSNQFPSSGTVIADTILVNGGIKVNNGVLAKGGAPGVNGANKAGYAFSGNSGDNDSGLFSTADGKASLYSNNAEILSVTPGTATVNGTLNTNNVDIINNGSLKYNGLSDWRLADLDDLVTHDDWFSYSPNGQNTGWNNSTNAGQPCLCGGGTFVGNILQPSNNNQVLKKQFNIPGTWSQMKVKFRYYFLDTWGWGGGDMAFAGFATNAGGSTFRVGWSYLGNWLQSNGNFNNATAVTAVNIGGSNDSDYYMDVEMTARRDGNLSNFWVFIGAALDEGTSNESYAIGPVEVYVR